MSRRVCLGISAGMVLILLLVLFWRLSWEENPKLPMPFHSPEPGAVRTFLIVQVIAAQGLVSPGAGSPVVPQGAVALGVVQCDAFVLDSEEVVPVITAQELL